MLVVKIADKPWYYCTYKRLHLQFSFFVSCRATVHITVYVASSPSSVITPLSYIVTLRYLICSSICFLIYLLMWSNLPSFMVNSLACSINQTFFSLPYTVIIKSAKNAQLKNRILCVFCFSIFITLLWYDLCRY